MKKCVFIALAGIVLAGLPARGQVTCDRFNVVTRLVGANLECMIRTDLPQDTIVQVNVFRYYKRKGDKRSYREIYSTGRSYLKQWQTYRRIPVTDSVWKDALKKRQEAMEAAKTPFELEAVDEHVGVEVIVTTGQSNVAFGRSNERLRGDKVQKIRHANTVVESVLVKAPMPGMPSYSSRDALFTKLKDQAGEELAAEKKSAEKK